MEIVRAMKRILFSRNENRQYLIKPSMMKNTWTEKMKACPNLSVGMPNTVCTWNPPLLEVHSTKIKIAHAMEGN